MSQRNLWLASCMVACAAGFSQAFQTGVPAPKEEPAAPAKPAVTPVKQVSSIRVALAVPEREGILQASRVLVLFARANERVKEPRATLSDWFNPPQIFGADWKPVDGVMELRPDWAGYPQTLSELAAGDYFVQAVVKRNQDRCQTGGNDGDVYSEGQRIHWDPEAKSELAISVGKVHKEPPFPEVARLKVFEARSELLSTFFGREVKQRASVFLPKDFAKDSEKHYPVVVLIGGFGSTHYDIGNMAKAFPADFLAQVILVTPDPSSLYGHCVFADSANNGPRGRALVNELLPAIEKEYRGLGVGHRYVTGVSSGGWSSLWLQVTYPEQFNGCWAFCPDPVDFRDFQQIDLYAADANMYKKPGGERRPLARNTSGVATLWYDNFVRMETAIGPGGQIGAFEGVFSPRGADGKPMPLFDRVTGAVNPATVKAWEAYDIRKVIESHWTELAKELPQKVHVYAGGNDTFYLEGAAKLLKESLKNLASDAMVEVIPGMVHTLYKPGATSMVRDVCKREGLTVKLMDPDPAPATGTGK